MRERLAYGLCGTVVLEPASPGSLVRRFLAIASPRQTLLDSEKNWSKNCFSYPGTTPTVFCTASPQPQNIGYNLRRRKHNLTLFTNVNAVIKQTMSIECYSEISINCVFVLLLFCIHCIIFFRCFYIIDFMFSFTFHSMLHVRLSYVY